MPLYRGACSITVVSVAGPWPQRITVAVRGGDDIEIPGEVGQSLVVDAGEWSLVLEHRVDGRWRQNIRAVVGRWTPNGESGQTQTIRSRDADGSPRGYGDSLVLRLQRSSEGFKASALGRPTSPAHPRISMIPSSADEISHRTARPTTSGGPGRRDRPADAVTMSSGGPLAEEHGSERRITTSGADYP